MYFLALPQQSSLLGLYGPVLLHLLGNTGKYSPSCQYCPTRKDNTGYITFRNWECLYYDSNRYIQWNIAWFLGNPAGFALGMIQMMIQIPLMQLFGGRWYWHKQVQTKFKSRSEMLLKAGYRRGFWLAKFIAMPKSFQSPYIRTTFSHFLKWGRSKHTCN